MVLHPLEGVEAVSLQEGGVREAWLEGWPAARVEGGVREGGYPAAQGEGGWLQVLYLSPVGSG